MPLSSSRGPENATQLPAGCQDVPPTRYSDRGRVPLIKEKTLKILHTFIRRSAKLRARMLIERDQIDFGRNATQEFGHPCGVV